MIRQADAMDVLRSLEDGSVQLHLWDPPYYRVKAEAWDRAWSSAEDFVAWYRELLVEARRTLAPNGTIYTFCSPGLAWHQEGAFRDVFRLLSRVTWHKDDSIAHRVCRADLRTYFDDSEVVLVGEWHGADASADDAAGWSSTCERLRSDVMEPLRAYLRGELKRSGVGKVACNVACGFSASSGGMASRHYFSRSQWCLPTAEHYAALRALFNREGTRPAPPVEDYHDANGLRLHQGNDGPEYLRADYEDLRRPFDVAAGTGRPFRAVWSYSPVESYAGKHSCEKPIAMIRDIVETASRPGDVVCDVFAGSGVTLAACHQTGRTAWVSDASPKWAERLRWLAEHPEAMRGFQGTRYRRPAAREALARQGSLALAVSA